MEIGRYDRDMHALMSIGERRHVASIQHRRLEAVTSGRAALDHDAGHALVYLVHEALSGEKALAQAFAQPVGVVAADAYRIVVVDLYISEAVAAELVYHSASEIFPYLRLLHIEEGPSARDRETVPRKKHILVFIHLA